VNPGSLVTGGVPGRFSTRIRSIPEPLSDNGVAESRFGIGVFPWSDIADDSGSTLGSRSHPDQNQIGPAVRGSLPMPVAPRTIGASRSSY
jgi:hypothetical protein